LDLTDGNLKPSPRAHFTSPNFPTDGPAGPFGGTGCAPLDWTTHNLLAQGTVHSVCLGVLPPLPESTRQKENGSW